MGCLDAKHKIIDHTFAILCNTVSTRSHSVIAERKEQTQVAHMTMWQLLHATLFHWAFPYSTRCEELYTILSVRAWKHTHVHLHVHSHVQPMYYTHTQSLPHPLTFISNHPTHTPFSSCSTSLTLIWEELKRQWTTVLFTVWVLNHTAIA